LPDFFAYPQMFYQTTLKYHPLIFAVSPLLSLFSISFLYLL
jgi:hypothetical protein